jgi:hypothetical protein
MKLSGPPKSILILYSIVSLRGAAASVVRNGKAAYPAAPWQSISRWVVKRELKIVGFRFAQPNLREYAIAFSWVAQTARLSGSRSAAQRQEVRRRAAKTRRPLAPAAPGQPVVRATRGGWLKTGIKESLSFRASPLSPNYAMLYLFCKPWRAGIKKAPRRLAERL